MKQIILFIWIMISLTLVGRANNLRVEGDVRILAADVDQGTNIATVRFTVKWDNSWRDAFNYDGVYLFFKYKLDGRDGIWHHAYLMDEGHTVASEYEIHMQKSLTTVDRCEGLFISRSGEGSGPAEVDLELKWKIISNADCSLKHSDFVQENVFLSAMGMEMVYVPRSAFRIGDTKSFSTFKNKHITIPSDKDILSDANRAYTYTSSCQVGDSQKGINPPEFAVNRVNDPGTTVTNAWVGCAVTGDQYDWWKVEFDDVKQVFNIAIESIPGRTPTKWEVYGITANGTRTSLYEGTGTDWMTTSPRTYPCSHAIGLQKTGISYKAIEIKIVETAGPVVIKNVAMTTESIFDSVDNSVSIHQNQSNMGNINWLYADDGDSWTGSIPITYPNGYCSFWSMKYEVSQEQYVAFLNKLTIAQQKTRTILSEFESLKEGEYVFGPKRNIPNARNGIIVATQGKDGDPYVFANNLNNDEGYSQMGDGQTLACNFLNPGDLLAYADWCGLRPLSEMEYEKMARRPHPYPSIWNEYAWNTDEYEISSALNSSGKGSKTEKPVDGYVNAGNKIGGPIRSGAYAGSATNQVDAGASFWGLMELSGNLAELYYNANTEGRKFCATEGIHHGNGKLLASGYSDVINTYWPITERAFALRGGGFLSEAAELRISDRSRHWGVYATLNQTYEKRDSTIGFRLGSTAPVLLLEGEITLQNGMTSVDALPIDTVCSGDNYIISGGVPSEIKGAYRVIWLKSENGGQHWDLIEGAEDPSLRITDLININEERHFFKIYYFHRKIYADGSQYTSSRAVAIRVVNNDLYINRLRDTINGRLSSSVSKGVTVTSNQAAQFKWKYTPSTGNIDLTGVTTLVTNISYKKIFRIADFQDAAGEAAVPDDVKVLIESSVMKTCHRNDTINVHIISNP